MANMKMSGIVDRVEQKKGAKGIFNKLTIDQKMYNYHKEILPEGIKIGSKVDIEYTESPWTTPDGKEVTSRTIWGIKPSTSQESFVQAPPQKSGTVSSAGTTDWTEKNKLDAHKLEFEKHKLKVMTNLGVLRDAIQFLEMKQENEKLLGVGRAKPMSVEDVYSLAAEFQARILGSDPWTLSTQVKGMPANEVKKGTHPDDEDTAQIVEVEDVVD